MKVLFDQGAPAPLRRFLRDHTVETAFERGWSTLRNGDLIAVAEAAGFDVFVTTDRSLKYQQNLTKDRRLALVVLQTTSWPRIQRAVAVVVEAVATATPFSYQEVEIFDGDQS